MRLGFHCSPFKGILNKPNSQKKKHSHCLHTQAFEYIVCQCECQATIWDKSGSHLAGCVHLWCFRGSMVTSVLISGLCELTDDDWDYRTTATSSILASRCLAALTLIKNTSMQAWNSKTCMHTCTHTAKFYGVKGTGVLFAVPVTLLNFYDKCSMTNSSPPSLCLALANFSLVRQSHIIIQPHGNLSLLSRGKYDSSSTPLSSSLPTVVSVEQKQSLVLISPVVSTSAMRHLPYGAVAGFSMALRSICLNQYMRNKCFSH